MDLDPPCFLVPLNSKDRLSLKNALFLANFHDFDQLSNSTQEWLFHPIFDLPLPSTGHECLSLHILSSKLICTIHFHLLDYIQLFPYILIILQRTTSLAILCFIVSSSSRIPTSFSFHQNSFPSHLMAYIRDSGHNVPFVLQIGEDGYAQLYSHLLYAHFGFYLSSIYIEEEVLSKLGEVHKSILQLSFRDDEGQLWLLPPRRYRAFGINAALMAASTDLVLQPSYMSSIQTPLLHLMKLESSDNLVNLFSDSSEGGLPNIPPPTPAIHTPISNSKYNEYSKFVFTPISSSGQSKFSQPPCHSNICEYSNAMQYLRSLASFPRSRNKLASIDYDKFPYYKVQYLPPSYNDNVIFESPPSCVSTSTSKNTMDIKDKRFDGHTWCCTITSNIHNNQDLTFRKSCMLASWFVTTKNCDFFSRSSKRNVTEQLGQTNTPSKLGHLPPPDSTLVCKVYKVLSTYVNFCQYVSTTFQARMI